MLNKKTNSFSLMKQNNKRKILRCIMKNYPISRNEIKRIVSLPASTITNLTVELINEGYILEYKEGESTGGRRPILLSINSDSGYVISLEIKINVLKIALTDSMANILYRNQCNIKIPTTNEEFLTLLENEIKAVISKFKDKNIIGIGIGMHGIVDYNKGNSVFAPNLNLKNVNIRDYLEEKFKLKVFVENDVRTIALGEMLHGSGKDIKNFVVLNITEGLGSSIVINNEVLRGKNGIAGELGHIKVPGNNLLCNCGKKGCLQTLISNKALVNYYREYVKQGYETIIKKEATSNDIMNYCKKGDMASRKAVNKLTDYLSVTIINIINMLNPEKIILTGDVIKIGNSLIENINNKIQDQLLIQEGLKTNIVFSKLEEDASIIGSASLILEKFYQLRL